MLNDITLGQFYPTNSIIHRLDPRMKIVLTVLLVVFLFVADNLYGFILMAALCVLAVIVSTIPVGYILRSFKPLLFIIFITCMLNVFLTDGRILWQYSFLKITYEGVYLAVFMVIRLFLLITVTNLLTLTTSPILLTDGLERLMSPLKKIKVPSHEIAMMMTIALRFIPTLLEETDKIIKAQSARGASFTSGNIFARAKAMIPILIPLFISAFRRADELALAMECRCYSGGENRTRMRRLKIQARDIVALLISIVFGVAVLVTNTLF